MKKIEAVSSYIHYHYDNYDGAKGSLDPELIKNQIKRNFLATITQQAIQKNGTNIEAEEILHLLREMSSGGTIGSKLITELNSTAFTSSDSGQSWFPTGSGFMSLSVPKDGGPVKIPEKANEIVSLINEKIQNLIIGLKSAQQYAALSELKAAWSGTSLSSLFEGLDLNVPDGVLSSNQLSIADLQLTKWVQNVEDALDLTAAGGEKSPKEFNAFLRNLQSTFSNLGGHFYEAVVNQAGNIITDTMITEIDKTNNSIRSANVTVTSSHTGNVLGVNHKDVKPDIVLTANKNGLIINFGGSIKLSQQIKSLKTSRLPKISFTSSWTLGRMLEEGHSFVGQMQLIPYYEAGFGAMKTWGGGNWTAISSRKNRVKKQYDFSAYDAISDAWEKAKEASKYAMALKLLTGSGDEVNGKNNLQFYDTASLLIVNNRIYNMYDILNNIANGLDEFMYVSQAPGFAGYRSYIVSKIRSKAEKYHTQEEFEQRSEETKTLITKLYNKKISMSLNFNYYMIM